MHPITNQHNMGQAMQHLKTVATFSQDNPIFTQAALRGLIHKAKPYATHKGLAPANGLLESGAIIRLGRRLLINEPKFFAWIENQQGLANG
jgi:hypothetical protein